MFPSTISTFNIVSASDRLNSPSHSALHNSVSSVLTQVQTVIGVEGANSVVGSLEYLIKSPGSDGGGHIQTANKGGTGQTSFNKGDILVATSASVITKLAVGTDGQVLKANSSTASGIQWDQNSTPKIFASASVFTYTNSSSESSIFSITVTSSTLGTNNAIRGTLFVTNFQQDLNQTSLIRLNYGNNSFASILLTTTGAAANQQVGEIKFAIIGNGTASSQSGNLSINTQRINLNPASSILALTQGIRGLVTGSSSVNSLANQTLGMTVKNGGVAASDMVEITGYIIEKIQ